MKKVKLADKEYELDDEVANLLVDEGGVPFRNRAAEYRRKMEKIERDVEAKLAEAETAATAARAKAAQVAAPYTPNAYAGTQGAGQWMLNSATGQYVWVPAQAGGYYQPAAQAAGLDEDRARALAQDELRKAREHDDYEREQANLRTEWAGLDDEREKVDDYLRTKGYTTEQIAEFGPRDLRLVKDAYAGASRADRARGRNPQEVVLDTGGGSDDDAASARPLYDNPDKIRGMSRADLQKMMHEARMRPPMDEA